MQEQNVLRLKPEQRLRTLCKLTNDVLRLIGQLDLILLEPMHCQAKQEVHMPFLQGFKS